MFLDKYPHQLSGGQRQRVVLARILSMRPKLIVADEPVSMIDVSLRLSILNIMKKMSEEFGIAFVYITHDLATARYFAGVGKIMVMYLGRIVETGPAAEVCSNPKHPYTEALLSAVPVLDPETKRQRIVLPGDVPSPTAPPRPLPGRRSTRP
jgi:peptide/nickel transport system ATP-binding protein